MLDWHSCQIYYPLEIKILLLLHVEKSYCFFAEKFVQKYESSKKLRRCREVVKQGPAHPFPISLKMAPAPPPNGPTNNPVKTKVCRPPPHFNIENLPTPASLWKNYRWGLTSFGQFTCFIVIFYLFMGASICVNGSQ